MSIKSSKNDRDPRHDLSNDFVQALAADWKEHGAATIEAVRQKTPDKYCELVAKVVPKEMLISADRRAEDFSDCPDMHEIGRRLLLQTGILEAAITDTMIEQTVEANGNFVDRLLLIAKGN
jgi:ABC-type phosphonate transport system ATPase subunit